MLTCSLIWHHRLLCHDLSIFLLAGKGSEHQGTLVELLMACKTTATRHHLPKEPDPLPNPSDEETGHFLPALESCLWLVFTCSANTPEQVSTFFTAKLCEEFLLRQLDPFQRG